MIIEPGSDIGLQRLSYTAEARQQIRILAEEVPLPEWFPAVVSPGDRRFSLKGVRPDRRSKVPQ